MYSLIESCDANKFNPLTYLYQNWRFAAAG
jgi:hypothetical protein